MGSSCWKTGKRVVSLGSKQEKGMRGTCQMCFASVQIDTMRVINQL